MSTSIERARLRLAAKYVRLPELGWGGFVLRIGGRTITIWLGTVASYAATALTGACDDASSLAARSGPCAPEDGTYAVHYVNESDSSACWPLPNEIVMIPSAEEQSDASDAVMTCSQGADCSQTCSGSFEGFVVSSETSFDASATSYGGTMSETVTYPDGGPVSTCLYG